MDKTVSVASDSLCIRTLAFRVFGEGKKEEEGKTMDSAALNATEIPTRILGVTKPSQAHSDLISKSKSA